MAGNEPGLRAPGMGNLARTMSFGTRIFTAVALLLACPAAARPSQAPPGQVELDRMLAAVNGKVLTDGDLKMARVLNALLSFGEAGTAGPRKEEIDRLIDLELLRQELANFMVGPADRDVIDERMQELVRGYAEIGGLPGLLKALGMRHEELEAYVELQALILRFVNLRFRPFVAVQDGEVESYYDTVLVRRLRDAGIGAPPIDEVRDYIRMILVEEKVNQALERWLENIRDHSRIQKFSAPGGDGRP